VILEKNNCMDREGGSSRGIGRMEAICLAAILLLSLALNVWNNDFPLGYHSDEAKKVMFIKENRQDFHHPILMLQAARIVNAVFEFKDDLSIVIMGRVLSALFGVLIVFFSYRIFSSTIGSKYALFGATFVAVAPTMAVHSHYLKEDMVFTCFSIASLYYFIKFIERPCWKTILLFGMVTGLALSSQYKSILLPVMFFAIPAIFRLKGVVDYYKKMMLSFLVSLLVFVIINYPMFLDTHIFLKGIFFDKWHVSHGHDVVIPALSYYFTFHLMNSIIPGITLLPTLLAAAGMVFVLKGWKKTLRAEKIMVIYTFLFYFVTEASPLKPFPDFMRYIIPIIPIILFFSMKGILGLASFMKEKPGMIVAVSLCVLSISVSLLQSLQFVYHLNKDTRKTVEDIISRSNVNTKYEAYASVRPDVRSLAELDIEEERKKGTGFIVASSFQYERFYTGVRIGNQHKDVYDAHKKYNEFFKLPYTEIKPVYKSIAFSNPTLKIIDIRKKE